jgi:hypothetical protein
LSPQAGSSDAIARSGIICKVAAPDGDVARIAILDGGPLDGREHRVPAGTAELMIRMTDGAQHLYVVSDRTQELPDGRVVPVFEYGGRHFPLRST